MGSSQRSLDKDIGCAIACLKKNKMIAYPTEAVFGLGCNINSPDAIAELLQLKNRHYDKGFIIVGSEWSQVEHLTQAIPPRLLSQVQSSWPGPWTWVFPASDEAPEWITGARPTIAIRISAHPIVQALCSAYGQAIVSTSANKEGQPVARNYKMVKMTFGDKIAHIMQGEVGLQKTPTMIRDAISGEIIRK